MAKSKSAQLIHFGFSGVVWYDCSNCHYKYIYQKIPSVCPDCKSDMVGTFVKDVYYPRPKDYEYIYTEALENDE